MATKEGNGANKREALTKQRVKELQKIVPFQNLRRKEDVLPSMQMGRYYMPMWFATLLEKVKNFPVDPSDVWVCTFPKSGTTWVQQIVYLLITKDFEGAKTVPIDVRFPEIEIPPPYPPVPENIDLMAKKQPPRMVKSHLAHCMLPKNIDNAKIIYVYRNPRDMLVSFYHFYQAWTASYYEGTFDDLVKLFIDEKISYGPWPTHVRDFLEVSRRPNSNCMMVAYEDLKKDRRGWVVKMSKFLGIERTDQEIDDVVAASSFEAMKKDNASNYDWLQGEWLDPGRQPFIRKGVVGDWRNHFSEESLAKFDAYVNEKMAGSGLTLQYT